MAAQWSCCKRNAADAEQSFFFSLFMSLLPIVGLVFFFLIELFPLSR